MIKNVAVMAGGQSRRFNSDKTLEEFLGKKLIEYPVGELKPWSDGIVVVAKDCAKYSFLEIACVLDVFDQQCPMVGILTALKYFDAPVFVVAADTPFVRKEHAERLLKACEGYCAAVPVIDGKIHPLYAAYSPDFVSVLEKQISDGNYRLMDAFELSNVVYLANYDILSSENEKKSFININTKNDLQTALDFMQGE